MRNNIDEIRNKVCSKELVILNQSLVFVNDRISNERVRASKAETRAVATLGYSGVLFGIAIAQLPSILRVFISVDYRLIFVLYAAAMIFLLKSALFSFKALGVLKRNEVTPELVFHIQKMPMIDSLREEITVKIWEYYEMLPVNSTRLFWVNRAQRNIFASAVAFLILGLSWILFDKIGFSVNDWFDKPVIVVTITSIFCTDRVIERWCGFWHRNET
jgi:hypothetical protein